MILSYLILSYPILSYLILSYPSILSDAHRVEELLLRQAALHRRAKALNGKIRSDQVRPDTLGSMYRVIPEGSVAMRHRGR